ncbi:MAG TPA: hypothetical protein VFT66_27065 [Roseiflexaceae bacterium]|jgi:TolB protein|nr:hypothetical protein [Roseiflexaceae bacterium]
MTKHSTCACLAALLLAMCIAACGPTAEESPQPTPSPLPQLITEPTPKPVGPAPTVVAPEETLPGRLLFAKDGDIWMWQSGSGRQLTDKGNLWQPAWSPDGSWIAGVQREESYSNIVVMTATGSDLIQLTKDGTTQPLHSYERIYDTTWAFYPSFSPDGRTVIFSAQAAPPFGTPAVEYNMTLFSSPVAAGSKPEQLYADNEGQVLRPIYAPDGKSIVFVFSPNVLNKPPQILHFDPETNDVSPLPGVPEQSYDPTFSADGKWFAFATRDTDGTDVFAMPAKGGEPLRLTSLGSARAPAFSPDGKQIAFLAMEPGNNRFDLWVADITPEADGLRIGKPRQLTTNLGIDADSGLSWGR